MVVNLEPRQEPVDLPMLPEYDPRTANYVEEQLMESGIDLKRAMDWLQWAEAMVENQELTVPVLLGLCNIRRPRCPATTAGALFWYVEKMAAERTLGPKICGTSTAPTAALKLSWPMLLTLLRYLEREQIRATIDILLDVVVGVFGISATHGDLMAVVSAAPEGTCVVESVPWPTAHEEGALGATMVVNLEPRQEPVDLPMLPEYDPRTADFVEQELIESGVDPRRTAEWLRQAHAAAAGTGQELTATALLAILADCTPCCLPATAGALLWHWEKMGAERAAHSETAAETAAPRSQVSLESP
jgi:hypothetical protein